MIYLDHNATTCPSDDVLDAMDRAARRLWANPSSIHREGQIVRREVELARREVARLLGARPREIVFTASGSESLHMAVLGALAASPSPVVVSTAVEHHALRTLLDDLARRREVEVRLAPLDEEGLVRTDALPDLLPGASLVTIQWANNETGAIQPVREIARLCREHAVPFHTDATQWVGKMPVNLATGADAGRADEPLVADLLTCAPHKFHGPKGVGILRIRQGVRLAPLVHGSQELGRRGGTENIPAIVGAGVACREAAEWLADPSSRCTGRALRDRFEQRLLAADPHAVINRPGNPDRRIWNTSSISFPGIESETLLMLLSERGVCASAGSACSSGAIGPSDVLLASGVSPERAASSIRFSICRETTAEELDEGAKIIAECLAHLRRASTAQDGSVASAPTRR